MTAVLFKITLRSVEVALWVNTQIKFTLADVYKKLQTWSLIEHDGPTSLSFMTVIMCDYFDDDEYKCAEFDVTFAYSDSSTRTFLAVVREIAVINEN